MNQIPAMAIGRKIRAKKMAAWRKVWDRMQADATPRNMWDEQNAWEEYADACADLNECCEFGCHTHSPDYTHCEKHRPCND